MFLAFVQFFYSRGVANTFHVEWLTHSVAACKLLAYSCTRSVGFDDLKVAAPLVDTQSLLPNIALSLGGLIYSSYGAASTLRFFCCWMTCHLFLSQCWPSLLTPSFSLDPFLVDYGLINRKSYVHCVTYPIIKWHTVSFFRSACLLHSLSTFPSLSSSLIIVPSVVSHPFVICCLLAYLVKHNFVLDFPNHTMRLVHFLIVHEATIRWMCRRTQPIEHNICTLLFHVAHKSSFHQLSAQSQTQVGCWNVHDGTVYADIPLALMVKHGTVLDRPRLITGCIQYVIGSLSW